MKGGRRTVNRNYATKCSLQNTSLRWCQALTQLFFFLLLCDGQSYLPWRTTLISLKNGTVNRNYATKCSLQNTSLRWCQALTQLFFFLLLCDGQSYLPWRTTLISLKNGTVNRNYATKCSLQNTSLRWCQALTQLFFFLLLCDGQSYLPWRTTLISLKNGTVNRNYATKCSLQNTSLRWCQALTQLFFFLLLCDGQPYLPWRTTLISLKNGTAYETSNSISKGRLLEKIHCVGMEFELFYSKLKLRLCH